MYNCKPMGMLALAENNEPARVRPGNSTAAKAAAPDCCKNLLLVDIVMSYVKNKDIECKVNLAGCFRLIRKESSYLYTNAAVL